MLHGSRLNRLNPSQNCPKKLSQCLALLREANKAKNPKQAEILHGHILKRGGLGVTPQHTNTWNTLLNIHAKCGTLREACKLFEEIPHKNTFSWTVMVSTHVKHGHPQTALWYFTTMKNQGVAPDCFTYSAAIPACTKLRALNDGMKIHEEILMQNLDIDVFMQSALIDMYGNCGKIEFARQLFDEMPTKDLVSWNTIIAVYMENGRVEDAASLFRAMPIKNMTSWNIFIDYYVKNGEYRKALECYDELRRDGIKANQFTFGGVVQACAGLADLRRGEGIHNEVRLFGFDRDVYVANSLVEMYCKCGRIDRARDVFDKIRRKDVVSWNTMLSGYVQVGLLDEGFELFSQMPNQNISTWNSTISACVKKGYNDEALMIFERMQRRGVSPNGFTFCSVLSACSRLKDLASGVYAHEKVVECGYEHDLFVRNALIDMYGKCGDADRAHALFKRMQNRDLVTWNSMIAGYLHNGYFDKAIGLFQEMRFSKLEDDFNTFSTVLAACAALEDLFKGMEIHGEVIRRGFQYHVAVCNALLLMYSKCGEIKDAYSVFLKMPHRDAISWTAVVTGFSQNGYYEEAIELFCDMLLAGVVPDHKVFAGVLPACANLGSLEQGMGIHENAVRMGLETDLYVGTALIDMYAKCGDIEKSKHLFKKMEVKNTVTWTTMIAAFAMHGYGEEAVECFEGMLEFGIKPNHVTFVCLLVACCHSGLVEKGVKYFDAMSTDYQVVATMDHYCCIVDLLARGGHLEEAFEFAKRMPSKPDASVWACLLNYCRVYNNVQLGDLVAERLMATNCQEAGPYVLLSNLYASDSRWDDTESLQSTMKERGVNKVSDCSWIEVSKVFYTFVAEDG